MGALNKSGEIPASIQTTNEKPFVLLPLTGKILGREIQGNCFSATLQRLQKTVATVVAVIFDLIALPFRAVLFFSIGLCGDPFPIIRNPTPISRISNDTDNPTPT
jgi:hypothetical protein